MSLRSPRKERKTATKTAMLVRKQNLPTVLRVRNLSQRVRKTTLNTTLLRKRFFEKDQIDVDDMSTFGSDS